MGILCDYFRSASDAAAVELMERLGGGPAAAATDNALVDAVDLKGIEPAVTLARLVALARGVPWQSRLVETPLLWSGSDEGPWLMSLDDAARDTLARIDAGRLPELSARWGQIEELAPREPLPADQMVPVIEEISDLARRAREAGEHLYCWCSL
jgi:hypothetical protein